MFEVYGQLPSYRAMLDREGAAGAADIAIVGSADEVTDRIGALADLGVTDFAAVEFGGDPDEVAATRARWSRRCPVDAPAGGRRRSGRARRSRRGLRADPGVRTEDARRSRRRDDAPPTTVPAHSVCRVADCPGIGL